MPPEELINATDISPQALFYMPEDGLRHKVVVVAERKHSSGKNEADAANATLRAAKMISSGRLTKLVTLRSQDDELVTQVIERDGPIAYVETTTQDQIFAEDPRGCCHFQPTSRPYKLHILQRQGAAAAGRTASHDVVRQIVTRHQAAQRLLESLTVMIPYAELLQLPAHRVATRRLFPLLLAMIAAVALLRQKQKVQLDGVISADAYDYAVAYRVMQPILRAPLAPISDGARTLYELIRSRLRMSDQQFSRAECRQWSGLSSTEIRNRLASLVDAGVVEVVDGRRGVSFQYRVSTRPEAAAAAAIGLITPDQLQAAMAANGCTST